MGLHNRPSQANVYLRVLHALMLRNMRTRFLGSYWGYGVVVLWPVAHIFVLVTIMVLRGIQSPLGDSMTLFVATGAVPVLMFKYIALEMMKAVSTNKPLTTYPQVKIFDVVISCMVVEVVKGFTGLIIVFAILIAMGVNPFPIYSLPPLGGYCAAILLGVGVGTVNVGIASYFPGWMLIFTVIRLFLYMTSGIFFLPSYFPESLYNILKWNPALQIIEWVRLGYYPDLAVEVDYTYVMLWCGFSMAIGFLLERVVVRRRA